MRIDEKEKHTHIKWLGFNVCKRSIESRIAASGGGTVLLLKMVREAKGKSKSTSALCKLKADEKRFKRQTLPFFWEFNESWNIRGDVAARSQSYELSDVSIKLTDLEGIEIISIHWELSNPKAAKYQPHLHFNWSGTGVDYVKVHFPLSHGWNKLLPSDIRSYHGWLGGVVNFLGTEFPRCILEEIRQEEIQQFGESKEL